MTKKELKKMAYRESSFRLKIELDDFENWTLDDMAKTDKDALRNLIEEIVVSLSEKGI